MPYSLSHTRAEALRTTSVGVHTGSKLARSAWGTKRSARAAARWEIAGVARSPAVASAPAPTADFKNVRRSIMCPRIVWPLADHGASAHAYSLQAESAAQSANVDRY